MIPGAAADTVVVEIDSNTVGDGVVPVPPVPEPLPAPLPNAEEPELPPPPPHAARANALHTTPTHFSNFVI